MVAKAAAKEIMKLRNELAAQIMKINGILKRHAGFIRDIELMNAIMRKRMSKKLGRK